MSKSNRTMASSLSDGLANYSPIEMILHVMGNGLTAISGYTQLLQRGISKQVPAAFPVEQDGWQKQHEHLIFYLQVMQQREALLSDFLAQLRVFSPEETKERFYQCIVQMDLVLLLKRIIERIAPLHRDHTIQTHLPVQPLYITCDLLWMELVLEHIITHTIDDHTLSTPVDIELKRVDDPCNTSQEARIAIRINVDLSRQTSGTTDSQTIEAKEQDVCIAVCQEVIREHGGRMWIEHAAEQEEIVFIALPLVK